MMSPVIYHKECYVGKELKDLHRALKFPLPVYSVMLMILEMEQTINLLKESSAKWVELQGKKRKKV